MGKKWPHTHVSVSVTVIVPNVFIFPAGTGQVRRQGPKLLIRRRRSSVNVRLRVYTIHKYRCTLILYNIYGIYIYIYSYIIHAYRTGRPQSSITRSALLPPRSILRFTVVGYNRSPLSTIMFTICGNTSRPVRA